MRLLPYLTAVILLLCFGLFSCEKDYEELTILPDETDVVVVDVDNPVIDSTDIWDSRPGILKATPSKGTVNEYEGISVLNSIGTPDEFWYYIINRPGDCDYIDETPGGEVFRLQFRRQSQDFVIGFYENTVSADSTYGAQSQNTNSMQCIDSTLFELYEATDTRVRGKYVAFYEMDHELINTGLCLAAPGYETFTIEFDVPVVCIYE